MNAQTLREESCPMKPQAFPGPGRPVLLSLVAALLLSACAAGPTPAVTPASVQAVPVRFADAGPAWTVAEPAESQPRGAWWLAFEDPQLSDLIARAEAGSPSLQLAAARWAEARALLRTAESDRSPQLGVSAGIGRQAGAGTLGGSEPGTLATAGLNASYELDLAGRLRRSRDAAELDAASRAGLWQSSRLLVQAEVAQTYLQLRSVQADQRLVQDSLDAYRETLQLTERRVRAGDVAELDLARVQTEVAASESEALALQRQEAALNHALATLIGEGAGGFRVAPAPFDSHLPQIPAGVPGTVLARRPDVSAAQASVLAAQARVGVAQAAWFPSVTLTGAAGQASPQLGDLFQWSARAWSASALLALPLWDGGRREAAVQGAQARLDQALASYRSQILQAFQEVEDQLSALRLLAGQAEAQQRAVASAQRATALSESRYRNGLVSQLELLDARRSELGNRRAALQVRTSQYLSTVALVRALGGGWGEAPAAADLAQR